MHPLCSENGILGFLLQYIREWAFRSLPSAADELAKLSARFTDAATQLGLRHVPGVFNEQHGYLSSTHYRSLAETLELVTCDVIPADSLMGRVICTTIDWYWACRAKSFTAAELTALDTKTAAMKAAWAPLDTPAWRQNLRAKSDVPKLGALATPKMHRGLEHMSDYVRWWGPVEFLTTETSEALHKPLKVFFRTYVTCCLSYLAVCTCVCSCLYCVTLCMHPLTVVLRAGPTSATHPGSLPSV